MKQCDLPLGTLIDTLADVREERRQIAVRDKELEEQVASLTEQIKARLHAEGMDKATGKKATASLSKVVVGNITDWDEVCKYVKKTGFFQLFQRRISDPAFREILDLKKKPIPGLEAFEKENLNLRALSK